MLLIIGGLAVAATVTVFFLRGRKSKSVSQSQTSLPTLAPALLRNISSVFAPTVIADALILADKLTNTSSVFAPSVSRGLAVLPALLTNSSSVYAPQLNLTLSPALLSNAQTFYQSALSGNILGTLVTNSSTVYAPQLTLTLTANLLSNGQSIYNPTVVQGSAVKANTLTNTQTFYAPSLNRTLYLPLLNNVSVIPSPTVGSATSTLLSTPVVTLTTAAGEIPEVDITMGADIWAGFTLRIQRSTTGTKNVSDGSYTSPSLNIPHQIAADEIHEDVLAIDPAALTADGYVDPVSGVAYFQQYRWEREDGKISLWSNEITGTVTAATTALNTITGANKKSYLSVSGTPALVATGTATVGAPQSVRATSAKTGKKQFEVTITALNNNVYCGLEDGSTNLDSGFPAPGITNSAGVAVRINSSGFAIFKAGAQVASGATAAATGDVLSVAFDTALATVSFYRVRSGASVLLGTVTGVGLGTWTAFLGTYDAATLTANFGQSAFARTLDVGATAYG